MHSDNLASYINRSERKVLNIYFTAGYPKLDDTGAILQSLERADVDLIEIGIPFSDPIADGPVIQQSNMTALSNGMKLALLFEQLRGIHITTPTILMGYLNPVLQYGLKEFLRDCRDAGVAAVILPDLPIELYVSNYKTGFEQEGIANICLVTPQTSEERIRYIDENSNGFIYAVSSSSTTGTRSLGQESAPYLLNLRNMGLRNPILTGFNIKDKKSFNAATAHTAGGIIGSAFIRAITGSKNLEADILSFVSSIRS